MAGIRAIVAALLAPDGILWPVRKCSRYSALGVRGKSYISNCARMIFAIIATGYTAA